MLLKTTKQIEEVQTVEITLPAYFKAPYGMWFVKICEDTTIIYVFERGTIQTFSPSVPGHQKEIGRVVAEQPSNEQEFYKAFDRALAVIQAVAYPESVNS
jgi:hypothetical protein